MRNNIIVLGGGGEVIHNVCQTGAFVHEYNIYYLIIKAQVGYPPGSHESIANLLSGNISTNVFKFAKGSPPKGMGINLGYTQDFSGGKLSPGRNLNVGAY